MVADEDPGFDVRAWVGPSDRQPPAAAQVKQDRGRPQTAKRLHNGVRLALASSISVGLLLSGLLVAWLTRDKPAAVVAQQPSQRRPPIERRDGLSERIVNLSSPAGLRSALIANGIDAASADAAARAALGAMGKRQDEVRAVIALEKQGTATRLVRLDASFMDSSGAVVTAQPDGTFAARPVAASLSTRIVVARGEMNDTDFYSSAVAAGVTDSLISTFAQAFVYDFNFQTEIKAGDVFEAAFEQNVNAGGQDVGPPRLLFASLTTSDKARAVYRFQPPGEEEGWFDGNGRTVRRSFMRTPVDGARITSHFGMRFHPVLHYTRLHGGTDFAAPIGTPIYAVAGAVVTTSSPSACAGNMVILQHDNGWETRYFHLLRYAPDIHPGLHVEQGHQLGVVGTTGTCTTGPHLHYEVHIKGEKVDPESIPTEQGKILAGDALKAFLKERDRIDVARARYSG